MKREEINERRPWDRDKRSWIYYTEDIKQDKTMIYGETDSNIYYFDLETAQLSIWSGEWKTFIDFGISRLQGQMNYHSNPEGDQPERMRILYKGIEFHSDYDASDAEFLEFIDIKDDLERKYVNINRKGFTEEGERYFKEILYPGLMRAVREVLQDLGGQNKTGSATEGETFNSRVIKTIKEKCESFYKDNKFIKNSEKEAKLLSFIVSVCVIAYFSMRDEWDIMENMGLEKYRNPLWKKLIEGINRLLNQPENKELLYDFSKLSYFFNLQVYGGADYQPRLDKNERWRRPNIIDIFTEGKHWGIISCRRFQSDVWVSQLVALGDIDVDKQSFELLTKINRTAHEESFIESWGTAKCDISGEPIVERLLGVESLRSQVLTTWLLKNVPSIAAFCNDDGSVIFNVLSSRVYPSIFLNKNYKYEIFWRIMEEADKKDFQRFSTIIWQRRETVGCRRLPFSIYFVKFGFFPEYAYYKGIIPQEGKVLKCWGAYLKSGSFAQRQQMLFELASQMNIVECLNKKVLRNLAESDTRFRLIYREESANIAMEIASIFADLIVSSIRPEKVRKLERFLVWMHKKQDYYGYWLEIYRDVAYIYYSSIRRIVLDDRMTSAETFWDKWKGHDAFDSLCDAWIYCTVGRSELFGNEWFIELYERSKSVDSDKKMDRILAYLVERQTFSMNEDTLELSMKEYEREFIELAQGIGTRMLSKALDDNLKVCSAIEKKIRDRF